MAYGTYDKNVVDRGLLAGTFATAIVLEASTADILTVPVAEPITVTRFGFRPTVTFAYDTLTAKGVLTCYRYPKANSTDKVSLGTINLENGDAANKVYFVNVDNAPTAAVTPYKGVARLGKADFEPGDQVVVAISTAATGGANIAGDFQPWFAFHPRAEAVQNQDNTVDRTPTKAAVDNPLA